MDEEKSTADARTLTAEIVASYVTNNNLRSENLAELVTSVYGALTILREPRLEAVPEPLTKPVSVKKSIHYDYLISMEDGRQYQSLKRHLNGRGLTPADYRSKWDLPSNYPMVAPGYSERRSDLAKLRGFGRKSSEAAAARRAEAQAFAVEKAEASAGKPRRDRKKAVAGGQAE